MTTVTGPTVGDTKLWEDLKFCPCCNFAIAKLELDLLRFDQRCPNCNTYTTSSFYSYGSDTHRANVEWFDRRAARNFESTPTRLLNVLKSPPPLPKQEDGHD